MDSPKGDYTRRKGLVFLYMCIYIYMAIYTLQQETQGTLLSPIGAIGQSWRIGCKVARMLWSYPHSDEIDATVGTHVLPPGTP